MTNSENRKSKHAHKACKDLTAEPASSTQRLNKACDIITREFGTLTREYKHVEFGQDYQTCENVSDELILHRMLKSWVPPSISGSDARQSAALRTWREGEERIATWDIKTASASDRDSTWVLHRASFLIHKWLSRFKLKFSDIEFSPGETFLGSGGHTDVFQKLSLISHWTVTYDAIDLAADMCWSVSALRHAAWDLMEEHCYDEVASDLWTMDSEKQTFIFWLKERIFNVVPGARLAFVPKNADTDRTINIEPMFNMLLQRCVGIGIRRILQRERNDLFTGQALHRQRIAERVATIDFKNASDGHLLDAFLEMFPKQFASIILLIRSPWTVIGDYSDENHEIHVNGKLSSMGNGFTFEVMTMLLLAIGRVLDSGCTVYGDDVIIKNDVAHRYVRACEILGWQVNQQKSFIDSPFRESCGSFYHEDVGYLTAFEFDYCENSIDLTVTINKLRILSQITRGSVRDRLEKLWENLISLVPVLHKGPVVDVPSLYGKYLINDHWVETENWRRARMGSTYARELWKTYLFQRNYWKDKYQDSVICVISGPVYEGFVLKSFLDINSAAELYSVIDGLRKSEQRGKGKTVFKDYFVTRSGNIVRTDFVENEYKIIRRNITARYT